MEEQILKYIEHKKFKAKKHPTLRQELIKKQPNCYWCGCKLKLYPEIYGNTHPPKGFYAPDDMATIEHLYSRWDLENRYKIYENDEDKVLACFKCNHARSDAENKKIPNELMHERYFLASRYKKKHPNEPRILGLIENTQKIYQAILEAK